MRARSIALGVLVLLAAASGTARAADQPPRFFRIGTAATTGTYFQIGAELANAISKPPGSRACERGGSCGVEGLVAVAQATDGSIANVLAVGQGQLEGAFAQADVASWAYRGQAPVIAPGKQCRGAAGRPQNGAALLNKAGPLRNLRAIAALYPEAVHIVARVGSGIRNLGDLKGKNVALGEAGSGTLAEGRLVLAAAGLGECQLKAQYPRLADAAALLEAGKVDAFFVMAGPPVPAVSDAAARTKLRLLPIVGKPQEVLKRAYPFIGVTVIPAATYPGIEATTETVAVPALFIVNAAVPDELVYGITRALWQDSTRRLLASGHPAGRNIHLENALKNVPIPLHPGAARYYREHGMMVPDTDP